MLRNYSYFTVDSRKVIPGSLFFALPGEKTDGHHFLKEVKERGAASAVVSPSYQGESFGLELIVKESPLLFLQELAKEKLKALPNLQIVGITGSVGKTTTKDFIAVLLEGKFKVVKSEKNENSQVSLPLTVLNRVRGDEEVLVLEMGMSEKGEIGKLAEIAKPKIAVLTAVGYAHSAFFDSLEAIGRAKGEIFVEDVQRALLPKECLKYCPLPQEKIRVVSENEKIELPFGLPHLRQNLLLAIAVGEELGMSFDEMKKRFPFLKIPEGRGVRIEKRGITFIDDSYNASPLSVKAALNTLSKEKRRVAVLGSMKELGVFSEKLHEEIGKVALDSVDSLYLIGEETDVICDLFVKNGRIAHRFKTKEELTRALREEIREGDTVLLKGSNSHQLWKVLEEI